MRIPIREARRIRLGLARDFTKWDDAPVSLDQFADSAVRAYSVAMTPPMMPVVLSVDKRCRNDRIPKGTTAAGPEVHAEYSAAKASRARCRRWRGCW